MISAADDLGVATSGVVASIEGALENVTPSSAVPRVISPTGIPGDAAEQPHNDLSRALFNNDTSDNIPSQHLCPIIQEPPFDAVHFDVPTANGATIRNQQVYERSALYRFIATPGTLRAFRNIIHPFTRARIVHWTLSVLLTPLCRRLFTVSGLLSVFSWRMTILSMTMIGVYMIKL